MHIPTPPFSDFYFGPLNIHLYALCILSGFFVAFIISNYRIKLLNRRGSIEVGSIEVERMIATNCQAVLNFEHMLNIVLVLMVTGIIGARLYYVITVPRSYIADPLSIFAINQGGLGIMGGVIFGIIGVYIYCRIVKLDIKQVIWCIIPTVPIAQNIGRLGNWFNGELYGLPTDLPWGLDISRGKYESTTFYHPTFLYEIIWNLIVAVILWKICTKIGPKMIILPLYLSLYTFGRMFIEMLRTDNSEYFLGLRINLWFALCLFILSIVWLTILYKSDKTQ